MAAIRRPFKDPHHLALQDLGWKFHSGLFQGHSQRLYSLSISCQGIKYFNTHWTAQLVHTGDNSINLYVLGPIGPIQSSTVGIQSHSSISRWPELYWPNSDNTAGDPPSRISLSVFHIYWPPFSTWALFPHFINILDLLLSLFYFTLLR
ncbi:hypothetical protein O181_088047 [Austropuccinia psidii MF-1]|uniref:Uncharacterized protein n=1 Tax=Austropuccinia psidii MF-1 TaxID=1389203 RepID=A0A9Q3P4B6_9BASI|nr:hypothetical protein [Austropuccinia psidii MF-1]